MSGTFSRRDFMIRSAALSGGLILAACTPKPQSTPVPAPATQPKAKEKAPPPAPAQEKVTVRYASWWGLFITTVLPDCIKDFQDQNPNVTIELEEVPYGEAETNYTPTLVAGTAADILYHMNFMSRYYDQGLILRLDDYMAADDIDYWNDFYLGLGIDDWAGKIYGFPHMFETYLVLYNKTMIEEHWGRDLWEAFPDGNWDEADMLEILDACTQDLNGDGKIDQWGMHKTHRSYYYGLETFPWTRGDNIFDVQNVKYNFTSPTVQKTARDLLRWVSKDHYIIAQEDISEISAAAGMGPFYSGFVGLHFRMSPDVGTALRTVGDRFEWDVFYLPNYGANQAITRAGGHGHNVAKSSKVPQEAYEFSKFLGTTPGMTYVAKTKVSIPIYRKDPSLRRLFETREPRHDHAIMGVLEDRAGYFDHMRFHNEGECLSLFINEMALLYTEPYEQASARLERTYARLEEEMNAIVDYGNELPFIGIRFPFTV